MVKKALLNVPSLALLAALTTRFNIHKTDTLRPLVNLRQNVSSLVVFPIGSAKASLDLGVAH